MRAQLMRGRSAFEYSACTVTQSDPYRPNVDDTSSSTDGPDIQSKERY